MKGGPRDGPGGVGRDKRWDGGQGRGAGRGRVTVHEVYKARSKVRGECHPN
jgi:hypothetical protein